MTMRAWTAAVAMAAAGSAVMGADQTQRWEGSWFNDTFGSSGPATVDVTICGTTLTFTLDLGGFVFGASDPAPVTTTGMLNGDGSFDFGMTTNHPVYGTASGGVDAAGNVTLDLMNASGFGLIEIRGTWTPTEFRTRYDIFFTPGGSVFATGTLEMDFVPGPCPCDADGNGTLNLDDLGIWVDGFLASDLGVSDCDGNGTLNLDDLTCFVDCFLAGCV